MYQTALIHEQHYSTPIITVKLSGALENLEAVGEPNLLENLNDLAALSNAMLAKGVHVDFVVNTTVDSVPVLSQTDKPIMCDRLCIYATGSVKPVVKYHQIRCRKGHFQGLDMRQSNGPFDSGKWSPLTGTSGNDTFCIEGCTLTGPTRVSNRNGLLRIRDCEIINGYLDLNAHLAEVDIQRCRFLGNDDYPICVTVSKYSCIETRIHSNTYIGYKYPQARRNNEAHPKQVIPTGVRIHPMTVVVIATGALVWGALGLSTLRRNDVSSFTTSVVTILAFAGIYKWVTSE